MCARTTLPAMLAIMLSEKERAQARERARERGRERVREKGVGRRGRAKERRGVGEVRGGLLTLGSSNALTLIWSLKIRPDERWRVGDRMFSADCDSRDLSSQPWQGNKTRQREMGEARGLGAKRDQMPGCRLLRGHCRLPAR